MASILKEAKRGLRRRSGAFLHNAIHSSPSWLKRTCSPGAMLRRNAAGRLWPDPRRSSITGIRYQTMLGARRNRRRITSAGPRSHGIKTVINLRGDQSFGTRWLEEQACSRHGVKLVDLKLQSRAAPSARTCARSAIRSIRLTYPILVHCKSGADRAGLMSVLVLHLHHGAADCRRQEAIVAALWPFPQADTGVLDYVFDRYLEDNAKSPIAFWDWVETVYDPPKSIARSRPKAGPTGWSTASCTANRGHLESTWPE